MSSNIWENFISLRAQDEPKFELLPLIKDINDHTSYSIDVESLNLQMPLNFYIESDPSPIPTPEDREGYYGDRHFEYWLSGLLVCERIWELVKQYGLARDRYVELGSASGRVIRHLSYSTDGFGEHWAFDINWRHICWINRYLSKNIIAIQNSSIPSLPLEDGSVDFFSAMSVFTHIETFELQWLAEIRRILKPGGIAMVTLQTEREISLLTPDWPVYDALTKHPRWNDKIYSELETQGKIVFRWRSDVSYSSNVIYHRSYISNVWGRMFDVIFEPENKGDGQTMCLLVKR